MANTTEGRLKAVAARIGLTVAEYTALIQQGKKRCTKCKVWKFLDDFGDDRTRYDGKIVRCFSCVRVPVKKDTKGRLSPMKGKTHSSEARGRMSASRIGNLNNLGNTHSPASKAKMSEIHKRIAKRGPDHYRWKGGTEGTQADRQTPEYAEWRRQVYARDGFKCVRCGDAKGGNLNAHHIKAFAKYPALRFEVSNGETLCESCHNKEHFKPDSIRNKKRKPQV